MALQEQLMDDLKTAMKGHDDVTRGVIRLIRSAVQNEQIEKGRELTDDGVVDVLSRLSRRYKESIDTYRQANRPDLVAKEQAELAVVQRYMPQQMGRDEIEALAKQVIAEVGAAGPSDRGKVMSKLMPQVRGKADGGLVNTVVGELLGG